MANTIPEQVDEALQKGKLNLNDARRVVKLLEEREQLAMEEETGHIGPDVMEKMLGEKNEQIQRIIDK